MKVSVIRAGASGAIDSIYVYEDRARRRARRLARESSALLKRACASKEDWQVTEEEPQGDRYFILKIGRYRYDHGKNAAKNAPGQVLADIAKPKEA